MRRRIGALVVVVALVAIVWPSGAPTREPAAPLPAPERIEAPPPRPPAPDVACAYPAGLPRAPGGCAPRRDGPVTPGGVPARPWLTSS